MSRSRCAWSAKRRKRHKRHNQRHFLLSKRKESLNTVHSSHQEAPRVLIMQRKPLARRWNWVKITTKREGVATSWASWYCREIILSIQSEMNFPSNSAFHPLFCALIVHRSLGRSFPFPFCVASSSRVLELEQDKNTRNCSFWLLSLPLPALLPPRSPFSSRQRNGGEKLAERCWSGEGWRTGRKKRTH